MEEIIKLKKTTTLTQQLRDMEIGKTAFVSDRDHKILTVRHIVLKLKKQGYDFFCTEKGLIDGIKVTRLK
jgi:hypothetical protein